MRWQNSRRSDNVEDRRGSGGGMPRMAFRGGGATIVLALVVFLFTKDPRVLLQLLGGSATTMVEERAPSAPAGNDQDREFVRTVLASTEDVWTEQFRKLGKGYQEPKLVMFRGSVDSACGFASSAVGPFYCPGDDKVYLDTAFFDDLSSRFGAPGDFAQAYVIAHEVGHHVQNLLGVSRFVHEQKDRLSETEYNQLSVRLELQADFYAGLWAYYAQNEFQLLEPGDIDEALTAANAIGDDRLQKQARGHVTPDSFTHGTSAQRVKWFKKGFDTGDLTQGDTFKAKDL